MKDDFEHGIPATFDDYIYGPSKALSDYLRAPTPDLRTSSMSNHWDIYCVTCGEHAGFSVNHGQDRLMPILEAAPKFAVLVGFPLEEYARGKPDFGAIAEFPEFAAKHAEHKLTLIDEYGSFVDRCPKTTQCKHCYGAYRCGLLVHHEGPCAAKANNA